MKALAITQNIKDHNPHIAFKDVGTCQIFTTLPNKFCGTENVTGSYQNRTDLHEADGFWDIEQLPLGEHQKYGAIEQKGTEKLFHYPLIDKTPEEIALEAQQALEAAAEAEIQYVIDKYEVHKTNGWNEYQRFRAQIVLDIEKGILTELDAFMIEAFLKSGFDKIANSGDWKTARYILGASETSDPIIVTYKDKALTIIDAYILDNYDN